MAENSVGIWYNNRRERSSTGLRVYMINEYIGLH